MIKVSVRELKRNLSQYIKRSQQGERITVTKRGEPAVVLSPAAPRDATEQLIWRLVEKGIVSWSGRKFEPPKRGVRLQGEGPTIAEMLLEDRR